MANTTIDGALLKEMFLFGAALVERNRAGIDALNVFPVPDGDTGTNMSQTMNAASKDLHGLTSPTVGEVAAMAARGALKGARGNSGVILSQILRGFAKELEGCEEATPDQFISALRQGSETAYKAIMKPKEGTILTVARVIAEDLERQRGQHEDVLSLMNAIIQSGEAILKRTPDMLPVLKQAGVVDSGGKGLMVLYSGFLSAVRGDSIEDIRPDDAEAAAIGEYVDDHTGLSVEDIKFAYCTEYIVSHPRPGVNETDVARLRRRLDRIGDCVVVIGDLEVVKVHIHTNDPGKALQYAMELGELDAIKIDNMLEEAREKEAAQKAKAAADPKDFGMVAVALGDGLAAVFRDLLVDKIVDGGQTMNPSIEDILKAIEEVPAKAVFVLPNNSNIILAAQQAAELTEKQVFVIPTKSVPMGIAACIAFQPGVSGEENAQRMAEAAEAIKTGQVTYAVRDTRFDGQDIHEGDIMGLADGRIVSIGHGVDEVATDLLTNHMVDEDSELITLFYGEDVQKADAEALVQALEGVFPMCDIEMHHGGQPLYYYLLSVE